jgi:phospholipase C
MGSILSHNRITIETRLWKGIVLLLFGLPLLFAIPTTLHATSPIPTTIDPPCNLKGGTPSVTICTPGAASVVSLPVHIVAGLKDSHAVTSITLSIDGSKVTQIAAEPLDVYVKSLAAGAHTAVVKVVDSAGVSFSKSVKFTVTANAGLSKIRHIIFFMQENHSFDNYFGMLGYYRASKGLPNNIDGLKPTMVQYTAQGQPVQPYHFQTLCIEGVVPYWSQSWADVNGGAMDRFVRSTPASTYDPQGTRAMGHYDQTDFPYYYELATQFATSDRFFSSLLSRTIPNRMYLFAGTSFGHVDPDPPPSGGWPQPTIFDHLDAAGVSWAYYYQDNGIYLPEWTTYQRDAAKLRPISAPSGTPNWYADIQNEATLPSVIFIERGGPSGLDEHPNTFLQKGAANTAKILNALLASPSWSSSAFILTYDEFGGEFDHVIPARVIPPDGTAPMLTAGEPAGDFAHTGFRVPFVIVSPWVKPHFVSHTTREFTSILRLIEDRFGVAPLTARDAAADNMMEFFDFSTPHWLTPPALPLQPTNGACNKSLEKAPGF